MEAQTIRTSSQQNPRRVLEEYSNPSEHCYRDSPDASLAREREASRTEQVTEIEQEHRVIHQPLSTVGEWLKLCDIDLDRNEIRWPLQKLNELPDLRRRPMETDGQCIAWHIFKDERTNKLPSYETFVPELDFKSCRDAWYLERPIKLKGDKFAEFKTQLLQEKVSKMRILNIPVTEKTVGKSSQHQHSIMVRDRVQKSYDVGELYPVEVHNPTANVTPKGTATEIHHDSDPHISTARGRSDTSHKQPMKLWLLWKASENHRLPDCYSDTAKALESIGPCGYLIQYSSESLLLPANVPHAALSLSSHFLYGQTFHVQGYARDPTTFELELSARAKPSEAIGTVLTCYEEGLQDVDPRIHATYIDRILRTMSRESIVMRMNSSESYIGKVIQLLRENRKCNGICGLCQCSGLISRRAQDCWEAHNDAIDLLTGEEPQTRQKIMTLSTLTSFRSKNV